MSERKHADLWRELVDDAIDDAATVSVAQGGGRADGRRLRRRGRAREGDRVPRRAWERGLAPACQGRRRRDRCGDDAPQGTACPGRVARGGGVSGRGRRHLGCDASARARGQSAPSDSVAAGAALLPSGTDLASPPSCGARRRTRARRSSGACVPRGARRGERAVDPGGDEAVAVKTLRDKATAGRRGGAGLTASAEHLPGCVPESCCRSDADFASESGDQQGAAQ